MTPPTLIEVFNAYTTHPEFLGLEIEDVNQRGALDSTLLHIASRTGNLVQIDVLIAAGADINASGDLANTSLHEAALTGQAQAADLLLSHGADTRLKNEFGQTALDIAALGNKDAVCAVLERPC